MHGTWPEITLGTERMSRVINESRSSFVLIDAGAEWRIGFMILSLISLNKKSVAVTPGLMLTHNWALYERKLETWLSSAENILLLQMTRIQFPVPTLNSSQLPVVPAPGDPIPSFGLYGYCAHKHTASQGCTHNLK